MKAIFRQKGGVIFIAFYALFIRERKRMSTLYKKIKEYWTDRAEGYSQVNQDELSGSQNKDWERELLCVNSYVWDYGIKIHRRK